MLVEQFLTKTFHARLGYPHLGTHEAINDQKVPKLIGRIRKIEALRISLKSQISFQSDYSKVHSLPSEGYIYIHTYVVFFCNVASQFFSTIKNSFV